MRGVSAVADSGAGFWQGSGVSIASIAKSFNAGELKKTDGVFDLATMRLHTGNEHVDAVKAKRIAKDAYRAKNGLVGEYVDVHEIKPVKFGGSPTDISNKAVIDRDLHQKLVTPWWRELQTTLELKKPR